MKNMNIARRKLSKAGLACVLAASYLGMSPAQAASDYPNRPIRMIVAYAPGGSTDVVGRMFAQELSEKLGQSVVVENRPGGGTLIGTESVMRARPDGYTLLFGTPATVITPLLHKQQPYDVVKDLTSVSLATIQSMGILTSPALKVKSMPELLDYARQHPGDINFASSGNGSAQHLAAEALNAAAGIQMTHIPYKGAGVAVTDLLAGRVHVMITSLVANMTESVRHGKLNLLATTGPKRNPALKDIPAVAEAVPGFEIVTWTGVFGPPDMPEDVLAKLHKAMLEVKRDGKIQKLIESQAMDVEVLDSQAMNAMMAREKTFYQEIIERTSARID